MIIYVRCFVGTITDNPPLQVNTTTKLPDPFSLQKVKVSLMKKRR
jgi:hypothetical protein